MQQQCHAVASASLQPNDKRQHPLRKRGCGSYEGVLRSQILGAGSPPTSQGSFSIITSDHELDVNKGGEHCPNTAVMPAAWFRSSMVVAAASAVIISCVRCVHMPRLPCECVCMRVSERAVRVCEQRCLLAWLALFPASFSDPCLHIQAYMQCMRRR